MYFDLIFCLQYFSKCVTALQFVITLKVHAIIYIIRGCMWRLIKFKPMLRHLICDIKF